MKNYRGVALAGLEFGSNIPGALNTDYFESSQATFNYFAAKGFQTVRLPFSWERLQPTLNGNLDITYKNYIDEMIGKAYVAGLKVILDCHNYGRRKEYTDGGITVDFTTDYPELLYVWADYSKNGYIVLRDWGHSFLGTFTNPVSDNGYKVTFNMKFNSQDSSYGVEGLYTRPMYIDSNNYYEFAANLIAGTWTLSKKVAGVTTQLATGTKTWGTVSTYAVSIDVNQATNGKINVSVNATPLFTTDSINSDAALAKGKIGFEAQGVHVRIDTLVLNINGDTSSGGVNILRVGDAGLSVSDFAGLWTKLAQAYSANDTVLGYDLMNEPHDMPVPTTSSNYKTTSTVTLMMQAAINAIRAIDTSHYIIAEIDQWAGGQNFQSQYGSNPDLWLTDTANKLIISFHSYFDDDHSGSYPIPFKSSNNTNIPTQYEPIMQWGAVHNVKIHCGEFGVPNIDNWLVCLTTFLDLCNTYGLWTNHWAAGDAYSSETTLQPTGSSPNYVDRLQMSVVGLAQYVNNETDPQVDPPIVPPSGIADDWNYVPKSFFPGEKTS